MKYKLLDIRDIFIEKLQVIIYIYYIILTILMFINTENSLVSSYLALYGFICPMFIGLFFLIMYMADIKSLFKSKKWYFILIAIFVVVTFSLLFITTFVYSFRLFDVYTVKEVNVIDVRNNKILVDYSEFNYGDPNVIEINKPFYVNVKEGDRIEVKYLAGHPEKMRYTIDTETVTNILSISGVMVLIIFLYAFIKNIIMAFMQLRKK